MYKLYIVICSLIYSIIAQDASGKTEKLEVVKAADEASSNIILPSPEPLKTGKSFAGSVPFPPTQEGLGTEYGHIPPQGQFYPVPGPYQPYPYQPQPYVGGPSGYPNPYGDVYQRPPYYRSNYLQSYDVLYGRKASTT